MLVSQAYNGKEYVLETKRVKELTLPSYYDNMRSIYFSDADKITMMPVKFYLRAEKDKIALHGSAILPESTEKCVIRFSNESFLRAMILALENNAGIQNIQPIKSGIDNSLKFLYNCLVKKVRDALVLGETYPYTSFILKDNKIMGISKRAIFEEDADDLVGTFFETVGPYLSMFNSEKDQNVSVVLLDDKYKKFAVFTGFISNVENNTVTVIKKKIQETSSISLCESIAEKYHDNYMKYFFEEKQKERGSDIFADF